MNSSTRMRMIVLVSVFTILVTLLLSRHVRAAARTDISQIGPHQPILTFEKNENPQNIMVIYTEVDKNCDFLSSARAGDVKQTQVAQQTPVFDFYWLMDHEHYKPVHPLIKSGIRRRLEIEKEGAHTTSFDVKLNDLKELKTDLKDPHMTVISKHEKAGDCDVEAEMKLGPSDHDRQIRLTKIYSEAEKTMLPPFRKVKSVKLSGVDLKTGEKVERTYDAKM